jgi:cytochrome c(L)
VVPASQVPSGAETARTVQQISQSGGAAGAGFRHPLDNSALKLDMMPSERITQQVTEFQQTTKNPYKGNAQAISAGRDLYKQWCAACHLEDGTGRIGSNLVDNQVTYPRVKTDAGMFEVIYAGATGAMQAFGNRMSQDEILKIMAFLETLKK